MEEKQKTPAPKGVPSNEGKVDEYAEVPEEVLDKEELKELEEVKKEVEEKTNGKGKRKRFPGQPTTAEIIAAWEPKTKLGQEVKNKQITDFDEILKSKRKILEAEIVDSLIDVKSD